MVTGSETALKVNVTGLVAPTCFLCLPVFAVNQIESSMGGSAALLPIKLR
jgi:hypothetical protein